jgi:hypothetical protein
MTQQRSGISGSEALFLLFQSAARPCRICMRTRRDYCHGSSLTSPPVPVEQLTWRTDTLSLLLPGKRSIAVILPRQPVFGHQPEVDGLRIIACLGPYRRPALGPYRRPAL